MKISIVVPVYNEEDTIELFYQSVKDKLYNHDFALEIVFINDGSVDQTQSIIENLLQIDENIKLINFSRNFGKEIALFAGLENISNDSDAAIPIDVDLQDPIDVVLQLISKWKDSKVESVLAKRIDRSSDSFIKKNTARLFYKFFNLVSDIPIDNNVGDFRLLSKVVVERIVQLDDYEMFMKAIYKEVGSDCEVIEYKRDKRIAGKTNFNFLKLIRYACNAILLSSSFPLKIWIYIGSVISLISLGLVFSVFGRALFIESFKVDESHLIDYVLFLMLGIQLVGLGVIGEYIWKIYNQVRNKPRYYIKK